jgi:hypothetical protein
MNTKKILSSFVIIFSFVLTDHDFGNIPEGKDTVWYEFEFKNTGSEPLYISDVRTSCDCTLAEWPKDPIQPGKSGVIRGGYKIEGKMGEFDKSIIIFANTTPATNILNIKGKIVPKNNSEG